MAEYVDSKIKLTLNSLTQEKYQELLATGRIEPDQLYLTPTDDGQGIPSQHVQMTLAEYQAVSAEYLTKDVVVFTID